MLKNMRQVLAQPESTEAALTMPVQVSYTSSLLKTVEAQLKRLPDRRAGYNNFEVIEYVVELRKDRSPRGVFESLLGKPNADRLVGDWKNSPGFTNGSHAPRNSRVNLFLESNGRAREEDSGSRAGAVSSQRTILSAAGVDFAEDVEATIVCAAFLKRAKDVGIDLTVPIERWSRVQSETLAKLTPHEIDLIVKLKIGAIRSRSGVLYLTEGQLRAGEVDIADRKIWAFGSDLRSERSDQE